MRDLVTTCVEVVGFVCLVAAAFQVSVGVGLLGAGLVLIALGYLIGRG